VYRRIYLENFMCHERLSFDFGENMNFVIGNNGSERPASNMWSNSLNQDRCSDVGLSSRRQVGGFDGRHDSPGRKDEQHRPWFWHERSDSKWGSVSIVTPP
jgi:hypothetical protein